MIHTLRSLFNDHLEMDIANGLDGVAQDSVDAARLYRHAIEGGNADAMSNLE